MRRTANLPAVLAAGVLLVAGCASDDDPEPPVEEPEPTAAEPTTPETTPETVPPATAAPPEGGPVEPDEVEVITTGLDVPWDLAFVADGAALVSERMSGRILLVGPSGEVAEIGTVDGVAAAGEGGLMGIAVHDDWLYAYFTAPNDNRIVRMEFDGESLGDPEVVFDGIPKANNHNGGRIAFGPDGMLYAATGDAQDPPLAQEVDSVAGKILRLAPDGAVPDDNPFDGSPVWSYGHRNVQGIAFDDAGRLWATEFGPSTVDEVNLIEPGENYGWPFAEGIAGDDRFVDAVVEWDVAEASPSGIAYARDTLFVAALRGQRLWQIPVPDGEVGEPADFYVREYGRLRHVELAPDGSLWALTNNTDGRNPDGPGPDDDRVLRISLRESS
jgi:glucose/arabinose dehydrogenase